MTAFSYDAFLDDSIYIRMCVRNSSVILRLIFLLS